MENNENLVTEEVVAENVEQTTEETQAVEKTYTQAEVDDIVGKAKYRAKAQVKKDYDRKYGNLKSVLKAGTGIEDVEELTNTFKEHYAQRGVEFPTEPTYSKRDIEVLAKAEADEIIKAGFDEVIEEADRLNELGVEKMSERDKALFVALTNHIKSTETGRELSKIGVSEDVYNSKEFNDFASKFNSNTPIKEIYEIYNKTTQPKKEIKTMGSIKNNTADTGIKEFYSKAEAEKFTKADFDKNPALFDAVYKSMKHW
jgi:hypothetical protein